MADLRTAAQQVLEAWDTRAGIDAASRAFDALRAALAQAEAERDALRAEPVHPSGFAYRYPDGVRFNDGREVNGCLPSEVIPYYLGKAPPKAEPDHETRAELAEQQVVQLAEECDHYRRLWQKAQQTEPVAFDPAEALRLAEEFAQMKQAHGVFCNADSRRLMEEAHSALAAYLGIKGGGNG